MMPASGKTGKAQTDDDRSNPEKRLVEQQELWARHQRAAIATIVQAWPQPASA
jgi:hypothetical protein